MDFRNSIATARYNQNFHLLPGRLRISVPGLLNNQTMARKIARRLSTLPGIKTGRVNPISGQVLVFFHPGRLNLSTLLEHLTGFSPGLPEEKEQQQDLRTPKKPSLLPVAKKTVGPSFHPGSNPPAQCHTMEIEKLLSQLKTSPQYGLPAAIARERLQIFGPNEITGKPPQSFFSMLVEPLQGFMSKLLLVAAGVSLLVGESTDALVITIIVGLQAVMEAVQGYRAEKSLSALKKLSAPAARVVRDGVLVQILARELVPGDLIMLEAGDRVPADARLLEVNNLMTDEANLTGESVPVAKNHTTCRKSQVTIGDRENMVFAGTCVSNGKGSAVVMATGMHTEMGEIASLLTGVGNEPTGLQKQMETLGQKITKLVLVSVGAIVVIGLVRGRTLMEILRTGVSLAVGAIPEGLPAVVTVSLAFGVQRMVRRNAVVRRLPAVETLGGSTIICTDKTGTLTKNEMTVKEIYCNDGFYQITGEGYHPEGIFFHAGREINPEDEPALMKALLVGVLCNNATLQQEGVNVWKTQGDPTEGALLAAAAKAGLWWEDMQQKHCREREITFDSQRRMMTVFCREPGNNYIAYTKGAPDSLISRCRNILKGNEIVPLDLKTRNKIMTANNSMTQKALRVLAVAWRDLPKEAELDDVWEENNLIFAGLIGMADPPRPGVQEAISKCHQAGIQVVMITGDHKNTAEAVARKIGILKNELTITGDEMDNLTDDKLASLANKIRVYARTSPAQKLRIVRALKKLGHVVAMTGDGVNDAPAVKEADIGLAMGLAGTDVTREAAGITLSDDNFATIAAGIEEGRTVSENIAKSIRYVLSGNMGQVLGVFLAAVSGLPSPLLPSQILWVNLVTEGLPAMALAADPPRADCMLLPPARPETRIFNQQNESEIIRKGILSGIATFGVYAVGLNAGWSPAKSRTMAFSHLVMSRVFNIFDSRRIRQTGSLPKAVNPYILPAAGLSTAMLLVTMYVPALRPLFSTVPMGMADWALIGFTSGLAGRVDSLVSGLIKPKNTLKQT